MKSTDNKNSQYIYFLFKVVFCILTALTFVAITVFETKVYRVGSDDIIRLQVPAKSFTTVDLHAVENQEQESVTERPINLFFTSASNMKSKRVADSYDSVVFVLVEEELDKYTEDIEIVDFVADGSNYWIASDNSVLQLLPSRDSEPVEVLSLGTEVLRVSYGSNWSYVMVGDNEYGFVLSSILLDEKPEPTPTPIATATPTPTTEILPTATPVPTVVPEPSQSSSDSIDDIDDAPLETDALPVVSETPCDEYIYAACELNVRCGPDISYDLICVLHSGTPLHAIALTENGWYHLDDDGYVKAGLTASEIESDSDSSTEASSDSDNSTPNASGITVSNDFGNYCLSFVGTDYIYGGSSPSGFDCSGFVSYVMANYYGISLPHCAADIAELGTAVTGDDIQPGDVLCHDYDEDGYIEHVSIYIGDGLCVHASNSQSGVITANYPMGSVVTIRRFL